MIAVSDHWKNAQKAMLVPLSEIQIEYNVTEPGVQEDATTSASLEETFSSAENVTKEEFTNEYKYALLEHNQWLLDGSYTALPELPPEAAGFISRNLCGADGRFVEVPTITITFGEVHTATIPGLTISWGRAYDEWAEHFRITVYHDSDVVKQFEVSDNRSAITFVWEPLQGYNKIVIEILKWCLPHRRARLTECLMGIKQIYTKHDLMGFEHEQSADLLAGELPKNAIVFKLDNSNNFWNPDNPDGAEKYLIEKQLLTLKYGFHLNGVVEWVKAGTFYMSEWKTPANGMEATFTARDILEFCSDVYTGPRSGTMLSIVLAALDQSGIDLSLCDLDTIALEGATTDFSQEEDGYTCAEMLQMCANAAACALWQTHDGILHIKPALVDLSDYVIGQLSDGVNNSYQHPEFDLTKELKAVSVNQGLGYASNSQTGNVQTVDNPLIVSAEVAGQVAEWCRSCLKNRKIVSGEYRADPRLEVLDTISVVSKYGSNRVQITNVKYTYNGAFRGTFTGRVMEE